MGRRALPVVAAAVALVLVLVLVPNASPGPGTSEAGSGTNTAPQLGLASPAAASPGSVGTATGAGSATGPSGQAGLGGAGLPSTSVPAGSAGQAQAPSTTTAGTQVSVAKTGVPCGPGAHQFSWSVYAPPCISAFGGPLQGRMGSAITLSFRKPNATEQQAVNTFAQDAQVDVNGFIADMNTYIRFFNSQFELYGRHVVLAPFDAQGDYLQEDAGQDLAAAQADAVTAHDLGALADVSFLLFTSTYYLQDLAQEHVIGTGGLGEPDHWFAQFAPYEYSYAATGTAGANAFAHVACARMAGLPAVFSLQYHGQKRVFGLITPSNSQYVEVGKEIESDLHSLCGANVRIFVQYDEGDISQYENEATEIAAQMRSDGVTTVICGCDPIFPILLSNAAAQQMYVPEWLTLGWGDPLTRYYNQQEWSHALDNLGQYEPNEQTEPYHVFLAASGGHPPAEQYYEVAYYTLLMVYNALQLAGPDLNPGTFGQGWFSLPQTPVGQDGIWKGGPGAYSMADWTSQIGWWDPNATSNFDGKQGAWESCDGGRWFDLTRATGWGTPHTQLHCFGQ